MSFSFIVREGLSGMGRAKLPAAITLVISFFALVLLGLFGSVSLSFYDVMQELRGKVQLEVFLSDTMSDADIAVAVKKMQAMNVVSDAQYVSKDEAARIFANEFGEDVVKVLGSNPLPHSVKMRFRQEYASSDSIERKIVPIVRKIVPDADIRYSQGFLGQIERNARIFTFLTGGIGILISLSAIVLVGYTIRLAMYARQERIRTMRFVGATGWFIGAPYVIEGALQGVISGLFAALAIYLLLDKLLYFNEPAIYSILQPSAMYVYPAVILLGLLLGIFGSALSVGQYLRGISKW
ncbi:MAG: ABC transporter permease [Chlorobiaceae bacterium]|nr:ABC transporter permease [Chlorobiaceae bacterium]NTV59799.1 ABC transporter permease [Chlorobiaceae bacterium]